MPRHARVRRWGWIAAAALLAMAPGCDPGPSRLAVDLRTDLVPGEEFVAVETIVEGRDLRDDRPALAGVDAIDGLRVAELEVPRGDHVLEVRLVAADAGLVASRRVQVRVDGTQSLTVLIPRSCRDLDCGDGTTCVRGACQPLDCHEELNPSACAPVECEADAECAAPSADCAQARCALGACLAAPRDGACGGDDYCDASSGCRPRASGAVDGGVGCGELDGLLGYWPMEAGDLVGGQVLDRSGNDRHASILGAQPPAVIAGRVGDGLSFAETEAHVELPDLPIDGADGGATTFSIWIFREDGAVDETPLHLPFHPGTEPPRYDLWMNTDRVSAQTLCINTGMGECWGVQQDGVLGRWFHVSVVFVNGPTMGGQIYLDGAPVEMTCVFGGCTHARVVANPVTLSAPDGTYRFRGQLDELRVYDRALTPDEAAALYACSR